MSKFKWNSWNRTFPAINSFEEAKAIYNRIKPVQGPRATLDIRPLGRRDYSQERIVRLSPEEYTVTDSWTGTHSTSKKEDCRRLSFYRPGHVTLHSFHYGYSRSTKNLISQALPQDMWLYQERGNKMYLAVKRPDDVDYYCLDPDRKWRTNDLSFKRVNGQWKVLNPYTEYRYRSTAKTTKQLFNDPTWVEFEEYVETIWPMVDQATAESFGPDWYYRVQLPNVENILTDKTTWIPAIVALKGNRYVRDVQTNNFFRVLQTPSYTKHTLDFLRSQLKKANKHLFVTEAVPLGERCSSPPRWAR